MLADSEHNDDRWLVTRYLPSGQGAANVTGWYVVRICPCCCGERVTLPYPNQGRAERVRLVLLGQITTPSEPKLKWSNDEIISPPTLIVGQIWLDRHRRFGADRYVRIKSVDETTVLVTTVVQQDDVWSPAPKTHPSKISAHRFETERWFVFIEGPE